MWNKIIAAFIIIGFFFALFNSVKKNATVECEKTQKVAELETVKTIMETTNEIMAMPNAGRNDILKLMHSQEM